MPTMSDLFTSIGGGKREPILTKQLLLLIIGNELYIENDALIQSNEDIKLFITQVQYGYDGIQTCHETTPDVIAVSANLPDMSSQEVVRVINAFYATVKIIGFSRTINKQNIYELLQAGVNGYVLVKGLQKNLCQIVHTVHSGKFVFSPEIVNQLYRHD